MLRTTLHFLGDHTHSRLDVLIPPKAANKTYYFLYSSIGPRLVLDYPLDVAVPHHLLYTGHFLMASKYWATHLIISTLLGGIATGLRHLEAWKK